MHIFSHRTLSVLGIALTEATLAALLPTLIGAPLWGTLLFVVLWGTLAEWLISGWLPERRQLPALIGVGVLTALWAVKAQLGGGYGLLGWNAAFAQMTSVAVDAILAYTLLLIALYAFWRGTLLLGQDAYTLRRLFARATVIILLLIAFGGFVGDADGRLTLATVQVLVFFATSLLTLALTGENDTGAQQRLDWRGLLTVGGAVGAVVVLALGSALLFGAQARIVAQSIIEAVVLVIVVVLSPLLIVIGILLEKLLALINLNQLAQLLQQQTDQQRRQNTEQIQSWLNVPDWVVTFIEIMLGLVPILVIVALFVFLRRRRQRRADADEERESLWSWDGVLGDLRDLLGGLRRAPAPDDLRAALARLRDNDPASRIRRAYIRLLLAGEAREQPRAATQTPREYVPIAAALTQSAPAITTLTSAYERARYDPAAATSADADAAESAWAAVDGGEEMKR